MTLVNISLLETILGGFGPVASGKIRATYWAGSAPYLGVVDEEVRFTSTITVDAAGGHASVDLVPTGGLCCVRWEITDARNRMLIRHTTIPDVPVVAFGDLVDVDPATFEPSDAGRAAWEATLAEVQAAVSTAVDARDLAVGAAEAAGASADAAGMSAAAAAVSAGEAAGSASVAAEHEAAASDAAARAEATAATIPAVVRDEVTVQVAPLVDEAAVSASNAAGMASSAAESATQAGASSLAAGAARDEAVDAAGVASAAATGAGGSATAAALSATAAGEARTGAETARTEAEAARDLALAGQFAGAVLLNTGSDFNALSTPGVYRLSSQTAANAAQNMPPTMQGTVGVLEVFSSSGTSASAIFQRFTGFKVTSTPIGHHVRQRAANGTWTPWRFAPSQRTDTSAGLAVYTWDDVNNREQLIYGDTGWRKLDLIGGWVGGLYARRVGNQVYLRDTMLDASAATQQGFVTLPTGLRFGPNNFGFLAMSGAGANIRLIPGAAYASSYLSLAYPNAVTGTLNTLRLGSISFITDDAWPTTLPGTPA